MAHKQGVLIPLWSVYRLLSRSYLAHRLFCRKTTYNGTVIVIGTSTVVGC